MKTTTLLRAGIAGSAIALLGGCSQPPEPQATVAAPATPSTAAKTKVKTPFDALLKDEQKAKDVGKTLQDAAARQRQAIKDAGG